MRPQQNAAENMPDGDKPPAVPVASMRPQQNAAENESERAEYNASLKGFNEAAAKRCGKHGAHGPAGTRKTGFNEAAAKRCGKHQEFISGGIFNKKLQ